MIVANVAGLDLSLMCLWQDEVQLSVVILLEKLNSEVELK
jgi:hypothetical protein